MTKKNSRRDLQKIVGEVLRDQRQAATETEMKEEGVLKMRSMPGAAVEEAGSWRRRGLLRTLKSFG
jgi:hypothetical protein